MGRCRTIFIPISPADFLGHAQVSFRKFAPPLGLIAAVFGPWMLKATRYPYAALEKRVAQQKKYIKEVHIYVGLEIYGWAPDIIGRECSALKARHRNALQL